jgi:hypothetical protein
VRDAKNLGTGDLDAVIAIANDEGHEERLKVRLGGYARDAELGQLSPGNHFHQRLVRTKERVRIQVGNDLVTECRGLVLDDPSHFDPTPWQRTKYARS